MTTGGWLTMILSVGFVTGLFVYCLYRVLRSPGDPKRLAHVEPLSEEETSER